MREGRPVAKTSAPRMEDNDEDIDIDAYATNLQRQTEDTINLLRRLHSTTRELKQAHRRITTQYVAAVSISFTLAPRYFLDHRRSWALFRESVGQFA